MLFYGMRQFWGLSPATRGRKHSYSSLLMDRQPTPQQDNQKELYSRRNSIESDSIISDSAISSFHDLQPRNQQQELYQNYPGQYYQPQYEMQQTQYDIQQTQYGMQQPQYGMQQPQYGMQPQYEQVYQAPTNVEYQPSSQAQTMPVYNQHAYAPSNVSYQTSYNPAYQKNQQHVQFTPSTISAPAPMISKESTNLNRFSSMSGKSVNTERYCCGMFKSKKKCTLVCIPLCLFILAAIGIAIFFVWPRVPTFKVGSPQNVNTKEFGTIEDLRNASPERPFRATFDLRVDITVQSENYIPWNLGELKIEGALIDPRTNRPNALSIGNGTRKNVLIRARDTTTFGFVIKIDIDIYRNV
jgi:hypothetical protein